MSEPQRKPHFSPSSLAMMRRCPLQYHYRYVEGLRVPPGVAMIRGTAVHASIEANLRRKASHGALLPIAEVRQIAADSTDQRWDAEPPKLSEDEREHGAARVRGETKDAAVRLAGLHAEALAPEIAVTHVERAFRVEIVDGPHDLIGFIDVQETPPECLAIDGWKPPAIVRDTKTKAKSPSANEVAMNDQLTVYSLAVEVLDGAAPLLRLDALVDLKSGPKTVSFATRRSAADHRRILDLVERAGKLVAAGTFLPAEEGCWACSAKWCGYYDSICPHGARGRTRTETWEM